MKFFSKYCAAASLACALFAVGAPFAMAEKMTLGCPEKLLAAPSAAETPEGWSASRRAREQTVEQTFSGATFSDGHPDELAFLRPSGESLLDGLKVDDYDLSSVTPEGGAWLICYYSGTPAFFFKKLEQKPAKCSTFKDKTDAGSVAVCE